MIKIKAAILALGALTAATTTTHVKQFGDQKPPERSRAAIPLQPVGDTVEAKPVYSPALQCKALTPDMNIDVINACAVKRVGWLKF